MRDTEHAVKAHLEGIQIVKSVAEVLCLLCIKIETIGIVSVRIHTQSLFRLNIGYLCQVISCDVIWNDAPWRRNETAITSLTFRSEEVDHYMY